MNNNWHTYKFTMTTYLLEGHKHQSCALVNGNSQEVESTMLKHLEEELGCHIVGSWNADGSRWYAEKSVDDQDWTFELKKL